MTKLSFLLVSTTNTTQIPPSMYKIEDIAECEDLQIMFVKRGVDGTMFTHRQISGDGLHRS